MSFSTKLRIFPVTMQLEHPKTDMECGGKVILPVSILHTLTHRASFLQQSPMLFTMVLKGKKTHCGVLEFTADEGQVNAPSWILDVLQAKVNDEVQITTVVLPKATFARFQPQSTDFLDISDPRAVLENHLRGFACLTEGDVVPIFYNNRSYLLKVEETKPAIAVCINECDMEVDFSPPVGYVETRITGSAPREEIVHGESIAFSGTGHRLDGKKTKQPEIIKRVLPIRQVGQPDYDFKIGTLEFSRPEEKKPDCPQSSRSLQ